MDVNGKLFCFNDKDTNSTYSGKNFVLSNQNCGAGKVLRAVNSSGKFSCVNIAYEGKIAADDFSQGEVNNLRAAKLDNGTTPWKDGNQHNHRYNVNDAWLRDYSDNEHVKLYGNSRTMVFRTDGTTGYSNNGGYPFIWLYKGDSSGYRKMMLNTSGQLWTSNYGWLHDKFQAKGSYAVANKSCPSGQVQRGVLSNGQPNCFSGNFNMQNSRIYNLGNPSSSKDAANKAYVDSAVLTAPAVQNTGRDFFGVIVYRSGRSCPTGWTTDYVSTVRGPNQWTYININERGMTMGGMNSPSYGHEQIYAGFHKNNGPYRVCTRRFHSSSGKPHVSAMFRKGSGCPTGYIDVPSAYTRGNNNWSHTMANDSGFFFGYIDTWSIDSHSHGDYGGYVRRHYHTSHVDRACIKVMGVDSDSGTKNGVFPVFTGVKSTGACPKGWSVRTTSSTNGSNGYFYFQGTRAATFWGGYGDWTHGNAHQQVHFHYTHVPYVCHKYFVQTSKPTVEIRTPHTGGCPGGFTTFSASQLKGWNNNGYIQLAANTLYMGGLYGWARYDLAGGFIAHNFTGEVSNKVCLRVNNVK